jgi:nicotinate-nucleotide pyrophosphorylase (carboxylating)
MSLQDGTGLSERVKTIVRMALEEDLADRGDITSIATVAEDRMTTAQILAREACTVCGLPLVKEVFRQVDERIVLEELIKDGKEAETGEVIARISGPARAILTAERTALNFMQRMTGVATQTRRFTALVKPYGTMILDTRKTTPAMRELEKYAVACGGGSNHRMGLYDRVMIKDNHRALWAEQRRGDLGAAVEHARSLYPDVMIELEVESVEELKQALPMKPEWVLLDNMTPEMMKQCVELCRGISRTEASGGITLDNVVAAAAAGVDAISLGCLTHSVRSIDLSLEIESDSVT